MTDIILRAEVNDDVDLVRIKEILVEALLAEEDVVSADIFDYDAKVLSVSSGDDMRLYGPYLNDEEAGTIADDQPEGAIVVALHQPSALSV